MNAQAGRLQPRDNPFMAGHDEPERMLADAFGAGTLAHAWLISGPEGIGKATLAYRFARFVLNQSRRAGHVNETGDEPESGSLFGDFETDGISATTTESRPFAMSPDNPVFRRIAAGGHADLMVVERAVKSEKTGERFNVIRVDDIREITGFLRLTPAEGGWRVVIVDAADEMNKNAQNALLKILEEPPGRSLIVLVCHMPGRLLPTIRSRCRQLALRPLPRTVVEDLVGRYEPTASGNASDYAAMADGSVGKALQMIDVDGIILSKEINKLFGELPKLDVPRMHDFAGRLARKQAESSYRAAGSMIQRAIRERVRAAAFQGNPSRLDRWLEVWDNSARLMERADSVNLDRKQVILGIMHAAADAAG